MGFEEEGDGICGGVQGRKNWGGVLRNLLANLTNAIIFSAFVLGLLISD